MKKISLNAVLAALCLFWMAMVSLAILHLATRQHPKPDLTLCPLCDQPVLISRDGRWELHPDTP
jgi:hypothetical protein